jgi:hypothetical protein
VLLTRRVRDREGEAHDAVSLVFDDRVEPRAAERFTEEEREV